MTVQTPWSSIGYLTYKRTYARRLDNDNPDSLTEEFPQTVERCINGIQNQLDVGFTDEEVNRLRKYMLELKCLPAGRFLWQLGTDTVERLGLSSLQNCFGGEVEFVTKEGIKSFNDFNDGDDVIIRGATSWKTAKVKKFGKQALKQLVITRGKRAESIRTTDNHRWILKDGTVKTTKELQLGDKLKTFSKKTNFHNLKMCPIGIQHGLVFGDGNWNENAKACAITPCGDSAEEMKSFFLGHDTSKKEINGLPWHWKTLPKLEEVNKHYLYGFLAGWFAADGSIAENGSNVTMASSKKEHLHYLRGALMRLDITSSNIVVRRELSPFDNSEKPLYRLTIDRDNLPESFFILNKHRKRFKPVQLQLDWKVSSITSSDEEEVWCIQEPTKEEFTLSNGVLTKNCAFTVIDSPVTPFTWAMDLLMLGSGVGYSIQNYNIRKIPEVRKAFIPPRRVDTADADFIVPDTREGWVQLLAKTLKAAFLAEGKRSFTYSMQLIRPKGSLIKGFGGVASGPEELHTGIQQIAEILYSRRGGKIKSIDALDIMNIIGSIVVAGNVRRCLPENALVHTDRGLVKIADVKPGQDKALTSEGYQLIKNKFDQGKQDLIKINTQDGEFQCTPNHRMKVLTQSGYKWVEAVNLQPGDRLISPRIKTEGIPTKLPEWNYQKPFNSTTCKDIIVPDLDEDMAWFLGMFQADGYTYPNYEKNGFNAYVSIVVGEHELEIAQKVQEQLKRFGSDLNVTLNKRKNEKSYIIHCQSKQLAWYFHENIKQANKTIRVPREILEATPDIRLAFVAGVADGDGCLHNKPIQVLTTVYPEFAQDIQNLLYSCGIESRLVSQEEELPSRLGWQKTHKVNLITLHSQNKFSKIPQLMKAVKSNSKSQNANGVPSKWVTDSKLVRKYGLYQSDQLNFDSYEKEYGQSKFVPTEVINIVEGDKNVSTYDIEVENVHEFYCNGYLTHNSAQIAIGDPWDIEFLKAKRWDLGPIPPWRGMSNNTVATDRIEDLVPEFWETYEGNAECYGLANIGLSQRVGRLGEEEYRDMTIQGYNPCQPGFATVLTKQGIKTFDDITINDCIWSKEGWTQVVNKWSTGVKPVYKYKFSGGSFIGTDNHRLVTSEGKVEAKDCEDVNVIAGPLAPSVKNFIPEQVMAGLFLGDGYSKTMKGRDYTYPVLCIGRDDQDYFTSEISHLILNKFQTDGFKEEYRVNTEVTKDQKSCDLTIKSYCEKLNNEELLSFLRGLYSANGSVVKGKGSSVRVTYKTTSKVLSEEVQLLLSSIGIRSYITTNKAKTTSFENGDYECKESYDVNITKDFREFYSRIGFLQKYKMEKIKEVLESYKPTNSDTFCTIKEIEYLGDFEVFDITVSNKSHTYWTGGLNVSNCAEQGLADGETCSLAEIFLPLIQSFDELMEAVIFMYRVNKHALNLHCHQKKTEKIVHQNMRMGIGVTGYLESTEEQKSWLSKAYKKLREYDKWYSKKHGFPVSVRLTTVKPSGTLSLLPGVTPGAHGAYAEYLIRRIRVSSNHPLIEVAQSKGYHVEEAVRIDGSIDPNTMVVSFPFKYSKNAVLADSMSAIEQLKVIQRLQSEWSDNSVSCTVYFKPHELPEIKEYLRENYHDGFKTLSFMKPSDHGFLQAPMEEITEEQYNKMMENVQPLTSLSLTAEKDADLSAECSTGVCPIR